MAANSPRRSAEQIEDNDDETEPIETQPNLPKNKINQKIILPVIKGNPLKFESEGAEEQDHALIHTISKHRSVI